MTQHGRKELRTKASEQQPGSGMKLIFENIMGKQEYLFCYFLTLLGADVFLLQTSRDIEEKLEQLALPQKLVLGSFGTCDIPEYQPEKYCVSQVPKRTAASLQSSVQTSGGRAEVPPTVGSTRPGTAASRQMPERRELEFEELALLASSVVMIVIHDKKGKAVGSGSGIMVGRNGYILTNHHVTSGGMYYSVRIEDDEAVYTTDEVIKYNQFLDLALIRIDRVLDPIPVYNGIKKLVRGQKVAAIGSPLGLFNSVSNGIISGFRKLDDVDMIQFTASISHGSSGGAVLNMYGEVIGISTAGIDSGQNINLAVGYEYIQKFIRGFVG